MVLPSLCMNPFPSTVAKSERTEEWANMGSIKSLLPDPRSRDDWADKIYDFLDKKSLSSSLRPFRKCGSLDAWLPNGKFCSVT